MHRSAVYAFALSLMAAGGAAQQNQCPDGTGESIVNGKSVCCPGILQSNTDCLVGCTLAKPPCFPFCSDQPNELTTQGSCTTVPLTASDYTSRVYSSAGGSGSGSGSGDSTTTAGGNNDNDTPTTTDSSASTAATGQSGDTSSSTSSGGAAAVVTEAPGLALAAIMAGVALL